MKRMRRGKYRVRAEGRIAHRTKRKLNGLLLPKVLFAVLVVVPAIFPKPTSPSVFTESTEIEFPAPAAIVDAATIEVIGSVETDNPDRRSVTVIVDGKEQTTKLESGRFRASFNLTPGTKTLATIPRASEQRRFLVPRLKHDFDRTSSGWKLLNHAQAELGTETVQHADATGSFLGASIETADIDIVFLIDKSGSMTRTIHLKRLITELGLRLPTALKEKYADRVRFGLAYFSDRKDHTLVFKYPSPEQTTVEFTDRPRVIHKQLADFFGRIENFTESGGQAEHIHEAIWEVMRQLAGDKSETNRHQIIVPITDTHSIADDKDHVEVVNACVRKGIACCPIFLQYAKDKEHGNDDSSDYVWNNWCYAESNTHIQKSIEAKFSATAKAIKNPTEASAHKETEDWPRGTQLGIFEAKQLAKDTGGFFYRHVELAGAAVDQKNRDASANNIHIEIPALIENVLRYQTKYRWTADAESVDAFQRASGEILQFSSLNCESVSVHLSSELETTILHLDSKPDWQKHRLTLPKIPNQLLEVVIQFRPSIDAAEVGLDNLMLAEEFNPAQPEDEETR